MSHLYLPQPRRLLVPGTPAAVPLMRPRRRWRTGGRSRQPLMAFTQVKSAGVDLNGKPILYSRAPKELSNQCPTTNDGCWPCPDQTVGGVQPQTATIMFDEIEFMRAPTPEEIETAAGAGHGLTYFDPAGDAFNATFDLHVGGPADGVSEADHFNCNNYYSDPFNAGQFVIYDLDGSEASRRPMTLQIVVFFGGTVFWNGASFFEDGSGQGTTTIFIGTSTGGPDAFCSFDVGNYENHSGSETVVVGNGAYPTKTGTAHFTPG